MNPLLSTSMAIGPLALLAALLAVPIQYVIYRRASPPKGTLPAVSFVLGSLAAGAAGYVIGTTAGVLAACSSASAGNLCGLAGYFGIGPLLSAVAIGLYTQVRTQRARHGP